MTTCSPASGFAWPMTNFCERPPARASREYLRSFYLAARESESAVEAAIARLLEEGRAIDAASVKEIVEKDEMPDRH